MGSLFASTKNTRPILPDVFRFIRSDVPDRLTGEEAQWLVDHDVRTVVDLREEEERQRRPCPLMGDTRFRYLCMPVTGGNAVPASAAEVPASYIKMADGQMDKIIDAILTAGTNVLYFCNAGKDRTGVVSAILLHRLGVDRQTIIDDYMASRENLKEELDAYARQNPWVDKEVITPHRTYMGGFLDWLCR